MCGEKGKKNVLLCYGDILENPHFATQLLSVGFIDCEWAFGKLNLDKVD